MDIIGTGAPDVLKKDNRYFWTLPEWQGQ
jgi:hypothetical protein